MQETSVCDSPDLPWDGRGASLEISGCRFSLYPMDSNFISIILDALGKTDTSTVWSSSDVLSTVYRGKLSHVADAVRGLFVNAYRPGVHMALEGQFSKGCPGDVDGDSYLSQNGTPPNISSIKGIHFPVLCKIALYPLGCENYIDSIAHIYRMAEHDGLRPSTIHYATRLNGDVHSIFDYLEKACAYTQTAAAHYVLAFTLSVNSPTQTQQIDGQ
ncbi:MAG: Ykof family thiamine-binding protein [Synergistaceae bacterium]|nr:Ykof family thiamine-binding protein [Synergistaceae bacterium]